MSDDLASVAVKGIVGAETGEAFVEMVVRDGDACVKLCLDYEEARGVALSLLEASESALSDLFLVRFVRDELGRDERGQAVLLLKYRAFRERQRR